MIAGFIVPPKRSLEPIDWAALDRLRAKLPRQDEPAAELIREMQGSGF